MLGLTPLETIRPIPVPGPAVDPGSSLPLPQIDSEAQYWAYRSPSPMPTIVQRPSLPRGFQYGVGAGDQEVVADATGRIVAGDPGQATVDQWLVSKNLIVNFETTTTGSTIQTVTDAAGGAGKLAVIGLLAFLLLRGAIK